MTISLEPIRWATAAELASPLSRRQHRGDFRIDIDARLSKVAPHVPAEDVFRA